MGTQQVETERGQSLQFPACDEVTEKAAALTAALQKATPRQLQAVSGLLDDALEAVRNTDIFTKYGFQILDDGFVTFTLPAGANYVELFREANMYCPAMPEGTLAWFADRAEATNKVTTDEIHDIQGLVPGSTDKRRSEQEALLQKNGLAFPTIEVAAAAAVLYYCATGKDLFENKFVRTAALGFELKSNAYSLVVSGYDDDLNYDFVGCAASRNRKS